MKRIVYSAWSGGLIALLTSAVVWAQATAQTSGTARDQSGAVLKVSKLSCCVNCREPG